jgi:hypothetical protein
MECDVSGFGLFMVKKMREEGEETYGMDIVVGGRIF